MFDYQQFPATNEVSTKNTFINPATVSPGIIGVTHDKKLKIFLFLFSKISESSFSLISSSKFHQ